MKRFLILLLFVQAPCWATVNQLEFNLGRGTPLSSIQAGGSSDREGSRGTDWSADFFHAAGPQVYWGIGGGHFRSNDNVSQTFVPNADSTITSKTTSILILTRADLAPPARTVPYVIAGIGWVRNSLSVTTSDTTLIDQSKNTVGFATGLGLDYALSDRFFIGLETRYQYALKRTFDLTAAGSAITGTNSVQTSMSVLTVGVKAGIKY